MGDDDPGAGARGSGGPTDGPTDPGGARRGPRPAVVALVLAVAALAACWAMSAGLQEAADGSRRAALLAALVGAVAVLLGRRAARRAGDPTGPVLHRWTRALGGAAVGSGLLIAHLSDSLLAGPPPPDAAPVPAPTTATAVLIGGGGPMVMGHLEDGAVPRPRPVDVPEPTPVPDLAEPALTPGDPAELGGWRVAVSAVVRVPPTAAGATAVQHDVVLEVTRTAGPAAVPEHELEVLVLDGAGRPTGTADCWLRLGQPASPEMGAGASARVVACADLTDPDDGPVRVRVRAGREVDAPSALWRVDVATAP